LTRSAWTPPRSNFEQKFITNNISVLRGNVNNYVAKLSGSSSEGKTRRFQINHLIITNGRARIGTGGALVTFPIANVDRTGIGAKTDGVSSAEVTRIVFSTFTESVLKGIASGALKEGASFHRRGHQESFWQLTLIFSVLLSPSGCVLMKCSGERAY